MNDSNFHAYKARFQNAIRKVMESAPQRSLDEAGFPAYSHPNPVINWLFWQRLHKAMNFIQEHAPYRKALDFGCGSGVMLPFLCNLAQQVTALDVDLQPFERMRSQIDFPTNLNVQDAKLVKVTDWPAAQFDLIVALDVLEHVKDLDSVLASLLRLLAQGGRLVVSGPTENIFYRIGRRLSGPEYTGSYHERGIGEIRRRLEAQAKVISIATLYWPLPLFEIFAAIK